MSGRQISVSADCLRTAHHHELVPTRGISFHSESGKECNMCRSAKLIDNFVRTVDGVLKELIIFAW